MHRALQWNCCTRAWFENDKWTTKEALSSPWGVFDPNMYHWVCISICSGRGQKYPYMGIICPYMGIIRCKFPSSHLTREYSPISTSKWYSAACSIVRTLRRRIIKDRNSIVFGVMTSRRHGNLWCATRIILNNRINECAFCDRVLW